MPFGRGIKQTAGTWMCLPLWSILKVETDGRIPESLGSADASFPTFVGDATFSCKLELGTAPFWFLNPRTSAKPHLLPCKLLLDVIVVLLHPIHQLSDVGVILNVERVSVVAETIR